MAILCFWNPRLTPKSQPIDPETEIAFRSWFLPFENLTKTEVPGLRPRLSYVSHFPKRAGFPLSPFPPSPTYRSKLVSVSPLVGFLASPTEAGEWILPTRGRRLRVSARCFYPLGQFQLYSLMGLRQGKKILNFVHISCAKNGFSSEQSVGVFSRRRAHTLSTAFSTRPSYPS